MIQYGRNISDKITIIIEWNHEALRRVEPLNHFLFNRPLTKAVYKLIRLNIAVQERHPTKLPNV